MNLSLATRDILGGIRNHEFWTIFAMNDIKSKYRRSKLGQWWITLSVAIFIFVIGGLYRGVFNSEDPTYLAYLAVGYILWLFISDSLGSGCAALSKSKAFLLQKDWPISVFIFRLIYKEILVVAHHVILLPPIFLFMGIWPGFLGITLAFAGFLLCVFTAFWASMILSIVSLRFRDFPPIVQSLIRMAFFATPIIWIERSLGTFGNLIILLNPFGYFLKIVREPLLTGTVDLSDWLIAGFISLVVAGTALFTLSLTKNKIRYWL